MRKMYLVLIARSAALVPGKNCWIDVIESNASGPGIASNAKPGSAELTCRCDPIRRLTAEPCQPLKMCLS
jgi:hypothetical protein